MSFTGLALSSALQPHTAKAMAAKRVMENAFMFVRAASQFFAARQSARVNRVFTLTLAVSRNDAAGNGAACCKRRGAEVIGDLRRGVFCHKVRSGRFIFLTLQGSPFPLCASAL
jgi:hypothetical protein